MYFNNITVGRYKQYIICYDKQNVLTALDSVLEEKKNIPFNVTITNSCDGNPVNTIQIKYLISRLTIT